MATEHKTAIDQKAFDHPDETRRFERGRLDLVHVGDSDIGRFTLEPGWRWSEHVKPLAGTDWCQAPHFQYQVAGTMHVRFSDGTELETHPGDVVTLAKEHDAWVVGDEPVVAIDWRGVSTYARR